MSDREKNIELRSDEIQDILGKVPHWLVRRGMIGISLVIIIMLVVAAWFKYPDRITSQIQLTTDHPPVYLVARTTAKIDEFFVEDAQEVNSGDLLVVLESSANYLDVMSAREIVSDLPVSPENADTNLLKRLYTLNDLELGNLQGEFAGLQKSVQVLLDFLRFDKYQLRVVGKEKELHDYRIHFNRLYDQRLNKEKELKIAEKQYSRMTDLHKDATVSDVELEASEQNYLNQKGQLERARLEMSTTSITMGKLEQSLAELKINRQEEELNAYSQIMESKDRFLGTLADWELKYLLVSPISGQISLSKFWAINQEVKEGSRVLAIVQEESGPILGKVLLPNLGAGKVKVGQRVIVRFDRYPHMEFGLVTGVINSISLVPEESNYHVEVGFPDGLTTSYNQELDFTQEMTGQADIITEDRSFLVRIVSPLKSIIKRNTSGAGSGQLAE